jgi:hypothetical protein
MRAGRLFGFCLCILLIASCSSTSRVNVQVLKPAEIHLPGVKTLAVVDFQGAERSGSQIASTIQALLIRKQQYNLI